MWHDAIDTWRLFFFSIISFQIKLKSPLEQKHPSPFSSQPSLSPAQMNFLPTPTPLTRKPTESARSSPKSTWPWQSWCDKGVTEGQCRLFLLPAIRFLTLQVLLPRKPGHLWSARESLLPVVCCVLERHSADQSAAAWSVFCHLAQEKGGACADEVGYCL